MWISFVFVRCSQLPEAKIMKKTAIHIQTFAIERIESSFLSSVKLTYIFDFKCLKYVKFIRFRMLPKAKILRKKKSAIHIQIFAIERRKLYFYLPWHWPTFSISNVWNMWNSFVLVCCRTLILPQKIGNTHWNICDRTAYVSFFSSVKFTYIFKVKSLKYEYLVNGKS